MSYDCNTGMPTCDVKLHLVFQIFASCKNHSIVFSLFTFYSRATENSDFIPVQSSVIFTAGQLSATVDVVTLDDTDPETAESLFVYIVSVSLLLSPQISPGNLQPNL